MYWEICSEHSSLLNCQATAAIVVILAETATVEQKDAEKEDDKEEVTPAVMSYICSWFTLQRVSFVLSE